MIDQTPETTTKQEVFTQEDQRLLDALQAPIYLCPCRFMVPICYNDGTRIPLKIIDHIMTSLTTKYYGYTILGTVDGSYRGQVEQMTHIEVAVGPSRIAELRRTVTEIGVRLEQQTMYFAVGSPCVELILTASGESIASVTNPPTL